MTTHKDILIKFTTSPSYVMDEPFRDMLKHVVAKDVITSADIKNLLDNTKLAASPTPFLEMALRMTLGAMLKEEATTKINQ